MNALETLLQPVTALLNRQIRSTTPARALCAELEDRVFAIRVRDTSLAMYIVIGPGEVYLTNEYSAEPDATVCGSVLALTRLAGPDGEAAIRDASVSLSGDPDTAQKFQALLRYARPDLEETLSGVVGDVVAHSLGDVARRTRRWGSDAGSILRQNLAEYLQEESRAVPSRYETDAFRKRVETLRDDVARIEARLTRLEADSGN